MASLFTLAIVSLLAVSYSEGAPAAMLVPPTWPFRCPASSDNIVPASFRGASTNETNGVGMLVAHNGFTRDYAGSPYTKEFYCFQNATVSADGVLSALYGDLCVTMKLESDNTTMQYSNPRNKGCTAGFQFTVKWQQNNTITPPTCPIGAGGGIPTALHGSCATRASPLLYAEHNILRCEHDDVKLWLLVPRVLYPELFRGGGGGERCVPTPKLHAMLGAHVHIVHHAGVRRRCGGDLPHHHGYLQCVQGAVGAQRDDVRLCAGVRSGVSLRMFVGSCCLA